MMNEQQVTRRETFRAIARGGALLLLGGGTAGLLLKRSLCKERPSSFGQCRDCGLAGKCGIYQNNTRWQIDPYVCISCGNCATYCVLEDSAVKCVHAYSMCGYCDLCSGFFDLEPPALNEGAENQLCPAGAIQRSFIEDPYFEYRIDESLCIGCGKCVKGCNAFGNGSLYLQIQQDRCLNCNQCAIAQACPSGAVKRVPAEAPYLRKDAPDLPNDKPSTEAKESKA